MDKIAKWINHNRFLIIGPVVALLLWIAAVSCEPLTRSPLDQAKLVNTVELQLDMKTWQAEQEIMAARFEAAGVDLDQQKQNQDKIYETILSLASGGVADLPGLLQLLLAGGGLGAITDNIRKRGLIAGLKRNSQK